MKPFNLERALAGDPVVTRAGKPVTQVTFFKNIPSRHEPIRGVIDDAIYSFYEEGKYLRETTHDRDLFMASEQVTKWSNIYSQGRGYSTSTTLYDTEAEAVHNRAVTAIATIPVTFEV